MYSAATMDVKNDSTNNPALAFDNLRINASHDLDKYANSGMHHHLSIDLMAAINMHSLMIDGRDDLIAFIGNGKWLYEGVNSSKIQLLGVPPQVENSMHLITVLTAFIDNQAGVVKHA